MNDEMVNGTNHVTIQLSGNPNLIYHKLIVSCVDQLPMEKNARGFLTTTGVFSLCVKLAVPLVYVYIVLIFVRELTYSFPDTINHGILAYLPQSFLFVEIWIVIEALFYVYLKLRIRQLQCKDPLEASLSAAP